MAFSATCRTGPCLVSAVAKAFATSGPLASAVPRRSKARRRRSDSTDAASQSVKTLATRASASGALPIAAAAFVAKAGSAASKTVAAKS